MAYLIVITDLLNTRFFLAASESFPDICGNVSSYDIIVIFWSVHVYQLITISKNSIQFSTGAGVIKYVVVPVPVTPHLPSF